MLHEDTSPILTVFSLFLNLVFILGMPMVHVGVRYQPAVHTSRYRYTKKEEKEVDTNTQMCCMTIRSSNEQIQ